METINNDPLSLWGEETTPHIQQHFEVFRNLLTQAKDFAHRGKYDAAAVYGDVAASYAFRRHCGLFVSQELEQVLLTIGQKAIPKGHYPSKNSLLPNQPKKILHVATGVKGIGGLTRMIWRWIQQDTESSHSLVLTRQPLVDVPSILRDAVLNSHGNLYTLSEIFGFVSAAKRLRQIAASADIVVLHISPDDAIPIIAFANKEQSPPILFLDHADHGFWLGASISDVVINLRSSGMRLAQERRGIEAERIALLPIILPPTQRTLSRAEAKRKLGFDENNLLLLSIARAPKYKTIDGINFGDAHVPLLEKYDNAVLVVIGPGNSEDWSAAVERVQGRIKIFPERQDTEVFYQAADIYVDSFPYTSITSLLEAGSYGVPLVSRYPYSDVSAVYGADAPGLDDNLIRTPNLEGYTAILSRLVEDEEFRLSLGKATQSKIAQTHTSTNWQKNLEKLYSRAATIPPVNATLTPNKMLITELDVLLMRLFFLTFSEQEVQLEEMIKARASSMPLIQKWYIWRNLGKNHRLTWKERTTFFLPSSLYKFLEKSARFCLKLTK
jgi:glycosyltransferase involved in cell wall biosynthesis